MTIYNLIEYSSNYGKTFSLQQNHRDDPKNNGSNSESFKFKAKIEGIIPAGVNTNHVSRAVPLKYLSNVWGAI